MTQAFNLGQLANFVNTSGQLDASTGLYNTTSLGFPTGTRMSFNQTAAPTGWTKDTSATINDSILRLVTGTVSNGGSTAFSTWNSSGSTSSTTLSTAQIPSHGHGNKIGGGGSSSYGAGGNYWYPSDWKYGPSYSGSDEYNALTLVNTGGGGSHSHSLSNNIKYYDFIIASKN